MRNSSDLEEVKEHELLSPAAQLELRRIDFRARRQVDTLLAGAFKSAFKGSGLTFADFREYQPGDDVRNIHWRATARTGRVYVKDYEEERQCSFLILLDASKSTWYASTTSVRRSLTEFAALIAVLARRNHDRIGLLIFDDLVRDFLKPKPATRNHYQNIINKMLNFQSSANKTDLSFALSESLKLQRKKTIIFLLSDFHANDYSSALKLLALKHDLICVQCNHEYEYKLPKVGFVNFEDAESGNNLTIDSNSKYLIQHLKKIQNAHSEQVKNITKSAAADFIQFETDALATLKKLIRIRSNYK